MKKSGFVLLVVCQMLFGHRVFGGPPGIDVDYARFKLDDENIYVEICYSIPYRDLAFVKSENGYAAQAVVRFKIFHNDTLWRNEAWRVPVSIENSNDIQTQNIVDVLRYPAAPGQYRVHAYAADNSRQDEVDSTTVSFDVAALEDGHIVASDIQLASRITRIQKDPSNVFYKNSLEVIPNASRLYGANTPDLPYYLELYNLEGLSDGDGYSSFCYISRSPGDSASALVSRHQVKQRRGDTSIEVGSLSVAELITGAYFLNFAVRDNADHLQAFVARKFFVFNPSVAAESGGSTGMAMTASLETSPFATMGESELDDEAGYLQYLMTKDVANQYEHLKTADAKR